MPLLTSCERDRQSHQCLLAPLKKDDSVDGCMWHLTWLYRAFFCPKINEDMGKILCKAEEWMPSVV